MKKRNFTPEFSENGRAMYQLGRRHTRLWQRIAQNLGNYNFLRINTIKIRQESGNLCSPLFGYLTNLFCYGGYYSK